MPESVAQAGPCRDLRPDQLETDQGYTANQTCFVTRVGDGPAARGGVDAGRIHESVYYELAPESAEGRPSEEGVERLCFGLATPTTNASAAMEIDQ